MLDPIRTQSNLAAPAHVREAEPMRVSRATFDEVMFQTYAPAQFVPVRASGSRIWDSEGRDYVDLAGGVAVLSLGHCHPALVAALKAQAERMWHVSNYMVNEPAMRLAKKLTNATFAERVFLCNSGTEANEGALKTARKYASTRFGEQKFRIVSTLNSFHGRTWLAVSTGGSPKYTKGMGPVPAGITHVPYNDVDALRSVMDDDVACIIVEPMQGEGGMHPGTREFLGAARELCDKHHALLIFDEIQSGVGRTGALFSYMQKGVTPDILTCAKGIGGGFPIGCFMARSEVAEVMQPGTHGTTYGGNPLAATVALTVLSIINQPAFLARVKEASAKLVGKLEKLVADFPQVFSAVRGQGLLLGLVVAEPFKGRSKDIQKAAEAQGLMVLIAGTEVLRLAPALIVSDAQIDEADRLLRAGLATLVNA